MSRDGYFLPAAAKLNRAHVPGVSLALQAAWAGLLVLLTTYSPLTGYGNLDSDLLDYIISAALMFYILTIAAGMVLRRKRPDAEWPYKTIGYPLAPILYICGASAIVVCLFAPLRRGRDSSRDDWSPSLFHLSTQETFAPHRIRPVGLRVDPYSA